MSRRRIDLVWVNKSLVQVLIRRLCRLRRNTTIVIDPLDDRDDDDDDGREKLPTLGRTDFDTHTHTRGSFNRDGL